MMAVKQLLMQSVITFVALETVWKTLDEELSCQVDLSSQVQATLLQ